MLMELKPRNSGCGDSLRLPKYILFCLAFTGALIVLRPSNSGYAAAFTVALWTSAVANTSLGPIAGTSATASDGSTVNLYLGVPFAAPPVGELRFAAPAPHAPWTKTRPAVSHGGCCVQLSANTFSGILGTEDCLVLDVYAPAGATQAARPVMVWFYGGSFQEGCISWYDATNLAASTGAVVVAVNYRLAALGFLGLPEQLEHGGSANAGLLDMQAGMRWVRANAAAFGGDPNRVTIFGQSAGGAGVLFQLVMPSSSGLFQAAILQSPGGRKGWEQDLKCEDNDALSKQELLNHSVALATSHGCGVAGQRLGCMRRLSVRALMAEPFGRFAASADGRLVADNPRALVARGRWHRVPLIIGGTSCESCAGQGMYVQPGLPHNVSEADYDDALTRTFSPARFAPNRVNLTAASVKSWYASYAAARGRWKALTRIASDSGHACNALLLTAAFSATAGPGVPVYRYEFRAAGGHPGQRYPGAVHASDLQYVFRTKVPYEPSTLSPTQDALARQMQRLWGELATRGRLDPHEWPPCTPGTHPCDRVMIFDTPNATLQSEREVDDGSAARQCGNWAQFM